MLVHIFKIIFNEKKRYIYVFVEQIFIFIILMLSIVSFSSFYKKYNKAGRLDTENVLMLGFTQRGLQGQDLIKANKEVYNLLEHIRKSPHINSVSMSDNFIPYLREDKDYTQWGDSLSVENKKIKAYFKYTDKYAMQVFKLNLIEGRWLDDKKLSDGSLPAVVSKEILEKLNWHSAINKQINFKNNIYTIVGVISGFKQNVLIKSVPTLIMPINENNYSNYTEVAIRVNDRIAAEKAIYDLKNKYITNHNVQFINVDLNSKFKTDIINRAGNIYLQGIPTIFLLIFAFIGTLGVFWLNSRKRVKEFALRLAIGSTKNNLMLLVIKESITISAISMIPGLLLSFFIYEFTAPEIIGIGSTIVFMLLFAIFSAWYPAYQVSKINPAEAIKYE